MSTQNLIAAVLFYLAFMPVAANAIPAFPGAEGWGTETPGGRGGKVLIVTNTNASGAGSFWAALMTAGPRTIVFRTSGVINLTPSYAEPNGSFSNVTIAGQTSPGGITITGKMSPYGSIYWCYELCRNNRFHDGIFRFLRFRGADGNYDGVSFTHSYNFIFDHCDFSGGSDETADFTYDSSFTMQWCTIANSSECGDCQTYGWLVGYGPTAHISMHHNFLAHHKQRYPEMYWSYPPPDNGRIDYRNNVLYNGWLWLWIMPISTIPGPLHINFVGNYLKEGPQSVGASPFQLANEVVEYARDNIFIKNGGAVTNPLPNPGASSEWPVPAIRTHTALQAYDTVLNKVGAWPRDNMNKRTVNDMRSGTGVLGKDDDGLITFGPAAPADSDNDGMPDFWELGMGLNPSDSADQRLDKDGDGYSNIEEYINDLALARLCENYQNSVYPIPSDWPDYNPSCAKSLALDGFFPRAGVKNTIKLSPNPYYDGSLTIEIQETMGKGLVRILDIRGRVWAMLPASSSLVWRGVNSRGRRVPPGVYIVDVESGAGRFSQKFLVAK